MGLFKTPSYFRNAGADFKIQMVFESTAKFVSRNSCQLRLGQRSEIRYQRSEVRGQRSDISGQASEVSYQRSGIRGQISEVRRADSGGQTT